MSMGFQKLLFLNGFKNIVRIESFKILMAKKLKIIDRLI